MPNRRGSVIIYCIGLAAILVVVGYGFLRSTLADTTAGDASHKVLLAQSAARMGLMRATECILADYAQTTMTVNQGHGGTTSVAGTTFLDGHWRAPFVALSSPNQIYNVDRNHPDEQDDVSAENMLVYPMIKWAEGDENTRRHSWHDRAGLMIHEGRGRYTEAGYHPVSRPAPVGAASKSLAIHRFTDFSAPVPERSEGLFLDRHFRRIDSGDPAQDRLLARYRLRYGIGVEDLSGHLLSNPFAGGDFNPRNPAAAYRHPPSHVTANQTAWYNMVLAFGGNGITTALCFEHVFLGRGNSTNIDIDPSTGAPVTFPMMFRHRLMDGSKMPFWGFYGRFRGDKSPKFETDGLYLGASATGGESLPAVATSNKPIVAHGYGPQMSWFNQDYALTGWFGKWEGDYGYGGGTLDYETAQFAPTPFGRRLERSTAPPADWKWYEGRVDTPWHVNLLTATPRTVHAMLISYLPPSVKVLAGAKEEFQLYVGKDARGHDAWGPVIATNIATASPSVQVRGRDNFTNVASPAFSYNPPSADGISPNYQKGDGRDPDERYPGALWNATDDFGQEIDADAVLATGACSHIREPFVYGFTSEKILYRKDWNDAKVPTPPTPWLTTPPTGWGQARAAPLNTDGGQDRVTVKTTSMKYSYSYWWDMVDAMTVTIATVRAAWKQWPTSICNPYTNMDASLHDPAAFDTLEEVDRLFLRQLGEDFDSPGSGAIPTRVIFTPGYDNGKQEYYISGSSNNCIRTLVPSLGDDKANVMERVLNDMRMSFFGASPRYSESFRPKDFSGDGQVHCSAYARNASASATDEANGVAWWKPAVGGGNGPTVDHWFSLSGCFFIGKSHYYRVFARGEIWDNLIQKTIADQTLETVICVDPEGTDPSDAKVLYQRWHYSRSTSHLPRQVD